MLYSGPPDGLAAVAESRTRDYLFGAKRRKPRTPRAARDWLRLEGVTRNNLRDLSVAFPLGCFTAVTGVSGAGKSSLVSQAQIDLVAAHLGHDSAEEEEGGAPLTEAEPVAPTEGRIAGGAHGIKRLVQVDQKPIGRTPRSNLATYTGLFDGVRKLFAATPMARRRHYDAAPSAWPRTACARRRTGPYTSPGWSAACGRSASGRRAPAA